MWDLFDEIADKQGWNDHSQILVLMNFIILYGDRDAFKQYLLNRQKSENGED